MKVYWFQRSHCFNFIELSDKLEESGFDGILFPVDSFSPDYFTQIARCIDSRKIMKYMVAIRPYTISPQYLCKINKSISLISQDRLLINLVTGWIDDNNLDADGIHEEVNDSSSNIDRSNYLINYLKTIDNLKESFPDFYVSVTNHIVFEATKNKKIIIPYSWYKLNMFDLSKTRTTIHISPIIRKTKEEIEIIDKSNWPQDTDFFTEDEFEKLLTDFKDKKIEGILLSNNLIEAETENIIIFIKNNKEKV